MADSADVELVVNGIAAGDGLPEKQRLEMPVRFKMIVTHATADGAVYAINRTPVTKDEFDTALAMAHVKQLDRIADLLEDINKKQDERGRKG